MYPIHWQLWFCPESIRGAKLYSGVKESAYFLTSLRGALYEAEAVTYLLDFYLNMAALITT